MRRVSVLYWLFGLAALVLAGLTGASARWDGLPWLLVNVAALAAVLTGLAWHRPADRRFWLAIAATEACWAVAALVPLAGGPAISSAAYGLSSALYVPGYLTLGWATITLLRKIGVGRPETLDAAIATALAATMCVPVFAEAYSKNGNAIWVAGLFPAWDVLLAMLLLRISFSAWSRKPSLRLLAIASLLLLGSDLTYFSSVFAGSASAARILSMTYTGAYLAFGAAALDPSMRRVPPRSLLPENGKRPRRRIVSVVGAALFATPIAFAVDQFLEGDPKDVVLAVFGMVLVGLVVLRVARLIAHADELRVRAEESEHLFRLVFDSAGIGISVGANGMLERTNPALQRMFGYSGEELAKTHFSELTHPDDRDERATPRAGRAYTFEKRYVRKDGRVVWAEVTLTAPPDDSFGIAVIEDVTVAKQLEDDLRHAQKMEAVGQLAGGIAHDFNNLMTAVIGYASLLQRELPSGNPARGRVNAIAAAAERAAELTRKLLAFSRRQVLRLEPLDLGAVVRDFDPILRRLLPENIVVDYALGPGAVARVDRAELEQVLLNLALNARDAMPDGGLLSIGVRLDGATVELSVADNGVGMDDETRLRIFDPFFTTKPVGQGTGLGLSTADGIVAQLGGTIDVVSEPNVGSVFTIRLPLDVEAAVAALEPESPLPPANEGTVLLVEDEEIVREVTTQMLRVVGFDVVAAASAEAALTLLSAGEIPDVLVSDVVMTGVDGPELVRRARAIAPDLPVLFVSGYPAETLGDRTAERVLTKPFTPVDLAEAIDEVRRAAAVPA